MLLLLRNAGKAHNGERELTIGRERAIEGESAMERDGGRDRNGGRERNGWRVFVFKDWLEDLFDHSNKQIEGGEVLMISLMCNKINKVELNNMNTNKSKAIQWLPCEIKYSVFAYCKTLWYRDERCDCHWVVMLLVTLINVDVLWK